MTGFAFQQMFARSDADEREPGFSAIPPEWIGPPSDELGWAVPLSLVVARSERAVVALRGATAYSTGVVFEVVALARGLSEREAHDLMHEQHRFPDEEERSPGFLRVGVEHADGKRASNVGTHWPASSAQSPDLPVLMQIGGSGGSAGEGTTIIDHRYWSWPLPADGDMRMYVEWPALDIALSSVELPVDALRAAAGGSLRLWEDE